MNQIVHIGYGDSAAGCLRAAIEFGMSGDKVVVSRDDFTQGPINDCLVDGGQGQRSGYWKSLKTLHSGMEDVTSYYASTLKALDEIESKSKVILWIGDSAHDILASAWLLSYYKNKSFDWHFVDLKLLNTTNEMQLVNVAMLTPEEVFHSCSMIAELDNTFERQLIETWSILSLQNSAYRIYHNNEVISVAEDFYDDFILSRITKKVQLLGKLMGTIMGKSDHRLTDTTIESRLVALQEKKKLKIDLNLAKIFASKVKLK